MNRGIKLAIAKHDLGVFLSVLALSVMFGLGCLGVFWSAPDRLTICVIATLSMYGLVSTFCAYEAKSLLFALTNAVTSGIYTVILFWAFADQYQFFMGMGIPDVVMTTLLVVLGILWCVIWFMMQYEGIDHVYKWREEYNRINQGALAREPEWWKCEVADAEVSGFF